MNDPLRVLGKNLERLRKSHGWTQAQAAENANLSIRFFQNLEAGRSWPSISTIKSLAKAFSVDSLVVLLPWPEGQKEESRVVDLLAAAKDLIRQWDSLSPARRALLKAVFYNDWSLVQDFPKLAPVARAFQKSKV